MCAQRKVSKFACYGVWGIGSFRIDSVDCGLFALKVVSFHYYALGKEGGYSGKPLIWTVNFLMPPSK